MGDMNGLTSITIRRAEIADTAELAGLHAESFGQGGWDVDQMCGSLALNTTQGWVAIKDGQACGFILCQVLDDEAEILTFCVRPIFRQNGIGMALVKHALKAMTPEIVTLWLEVAEDNTPAITLYEEAGFVTAGLRPNYYRRGDERVNAVKYVYITRV